MGDSSEATEAIRVRLEAISEELADLALDRLRDAVEEAGHESGDAGTGRGRTGGRSVAGEEERRLTRARRAVDKAVDLLAPGPTGE